MKITRALIQKPINEKEYKIDTQSILYFFIPKTNLFALTNKPEHLNQNILKKKHYNICNLSILLCLYTKSI